MSQPEPNAPKPRPRWTGRAVALVVIGLLILIPSGLCSGLMVLSSLSVLGMGGGGLAGASPFGTVGILFGNLQIILMFGGIPMALGAVLVYSGLKSRRRE